MRSAETEAARGGDGGSGPPKPAATFALRTMMPSDLPAAHRLSRAVSWPHRLKDWRFGLPLGEGAVATMGGEVVGTAMAWPYGADHATFGMIIVSPAHQGAGLGRRLMEALFARVGDRALMLNATPEGIALYRKCGFSEAGEVHQHQGRMPRLAEPALNPGEEIMIGDPDDLPFLAGLDAEASGFPRESLLAALLDIAGCAVLLRHGAPVGFSFVREFGRGFVIGPVAAADALAARKLIGYWLCRFPSAFLRIDVPDRAELGAWLTEAGLPKIAAISAMARGRRPEPPGPARCFALASQAMG